MSDLPLGPDDVNEIVAILAGSPYTALDIRTPRYRLRVARAEGSEGWTQEWSWDEAGSAGAAVAEAVADPVADGGPVVAAPLPGTFYRAPSPGAAPFVEVGSKVEPDTVVAIIETMKLMNPVHAGMSGKVDAILAENGEMVAKGAALIRVTPGT